MHPPRPGRRRAAHGAARHRGSSTTRATTVGAVSSAATAHHRKSWPAAPSGFFEVEAAGLRWLAEAQRRRRRPGRRGPGRRPRPHRPRPAATRPRPRPRRRRRLGRGLARDARPRRAVPSVSPGRLDAATPGSAGSRRATSRPRRGACSTPSSACGRSCAAPSTAGTSTRAGARVVDRVCDRLASGDLRRRPTAGRASTATCGRATSCSRRDGAVLIDPAAHGGHGLTDLAMLALFGCPGLDRVGAAYEEAAGLDRGVARAHPAAPAHPLAEHAASHGPAYAAQLVEAARDLRALRRGRAGGRCPSPFCRPSNSSATLYRFPP